MKNYIETSRTIVRHFERKDLDTFFSYRSNPQCQKYQCWTPMDYTQAKNTVDKFHMTNLFCKTAQFVIALKNSDDNIGDIFYANRDYTITIGVTIHPDYQNHGYAYEVLTEWIKMLHKRFPMHEICALVHPDNIASNKLFTKLGFRLEEFSIEMESNIYVKIFA